mmetsp:Transcript_41876/g.89220  ORF Transcript_41876/g.89220 Transcript_41876/m.89220 type:complete len:92 (+) Transcript_41876:1890-2165(+)
MFNADDECPPRRRLFMAREEKDEWAEEGARVIDALPRVKAFAQELAEPRTRMLRRAGGRESFMMQWTAIAMRWCIRNYSKDVESRRKWKTK